MKEPTSIEGEVGPIQEEEFEPVPEFEAYAVGLFNASICTSLPIEQAVVRMNLEHPSGVRTEWQLSGEQFLGGQPNPCPCNENPETHKHYLLNC